MYSAIASLRVYRDASSVWTLRDLAQRKSWKVDRLTAAAALAFMVPQRIEDVIGAVAAGGSTEPDAESRIRALLDLGLVRVESGEDPEHRLLGRWATKGWGEPFDYLRATWDYPFEDYSRDGQAHDRQRMLAYSADAPDDQRFLPRKGTAAATLPSLESSLDYFARDNSVDAESLVSHLLHTAAAATLPVVWRASRTPGADYMKRTSPSGGCRHPSEVYLLSIDVPGLPRGRYHVGVGDEQLGYMGPLDEIETLKAMMAGAFRLAAPPRAVFVISTVFARNMYRYREPRTLRTVFYDAGHLGGLIESLGGDHGCVAHGHHGFRDSYVRDLILSPSLAAESPLYLVAVGLQSEARPNAKTVGR